MHRLATDKWKTTLKWIRCEAAAVELRYVANEHKARWARLFAAKLQPTIVIICCCCFFSLCTPFARQLRQRSSSANSKPSWCAHCLWINKKMSCKMVSQKLNSEKERKEGKKEWCSYRTPPSSTTYWYWVNGMNGILYVEWRRIRIQMGFSNSNLWMNGIVNECEWEQKKKKKNKNRKMFQWNKRCKRFWLMQVGFGT